MSCIDKWAITNLIHIHTVAYIWGQARSTPTEHLRTKGAGTNVFSPGHLHGVLGEIHDPVDQVEGAEGQREEDAWVLVDDAGARQHVVGRHRRALLQEGLRVDRRVGEGLGGAVEGEAGVHPLLQGHAAGLHLGDVHMQRIGLWESDIKENRALCNTRVLIMKRVQSCFQS